MSRDEDSTMTGEHATKTVLPGSYAALEPRSGPTPATGMGAGAGADLLLLSDLATRINEEHREAESHARSAVEHALRCGELLIEAKAKVSHGQWLPWLKANCTVSERTARAYMQVARELPALSGKTAAVADLTLRDALKALSAPDLPEATDIEALEDAERREYGGFTLHPACRIWPRITGGQWTGFVRSIKDRGLIQPIILYQGQILDGKERMRACLESRVSPRFHEFDGGDPYQYTWSVNGLRQSLSESQTAQIVSAIEWIRTVVALAARTGEEGTP